MKREDAQDRLSAWAVFLLIDQTNQRSRLEPALLILSGKIKCILLGVCISVFFFFIWFI